MIIDDYKKKMFEREFNLNERDDYLGMLVVDIISLRKMFIGSSDSFQNRMYDYLVLIINEELQLISENKIVLTAETLLGLNAFSLEFGAITQEEYRRKKEQVEGGVLLKRTQLVSIREDYEKQINDIHKEIVELVNKTKENDSLYSFIVNLRSQLNIPFDYINTRDKKFRGLIEEMIVQKL